MDPTIRRCAPEAHAGTVGQLAERILIASACTREHLVDHARILAPTVRLTHIAVMTSARRETRRSISLAANASTRNTHKSKQGDSRWERSWSARTSRSPG